MKGKIQEYKNITHTCHISKFIEEKLIAYLAFLVASVGKSVGSHVVSASVQEADNAFEGFSYVPPSEDAFS